MPDTPAAPEPLTPLSVTEQQRDFLARALHNSERDNALLRQALAGLGDQLAAARARIAELEQPPGGADGGAA